MEKAGRYAFIAGIVVAIIAGVSNPSWAPATLAVLGIVVGLLNVAAEETQGFLLAAIALMMTTTAIEAIPAVGEAAAPFVVNVVAFIGAAVFVVAIKTLLGVAKS